MAKEFPLTWPDNWPRTTNRKASAFRATLAAAMNNVELELHRFGKDTGKKVENILVSSNYSLSNRNPTDSGVAVYFTWDGIATCIAVDQYNKIEDNIQAVFRCIEAERTKMRHGGLNIVRAAFRGYAALPAPESKKDWRKILNVGPNAKLADIELSFRAIAATVHPDKAGGSHEKMSELNAARAQAYKEIAD